MVKEPDIIFTLLRTAITGETPDLPKMSANQWWGLFRLLQHNHVGAMCATAVARANAPRDVLVPWMAEQQKSMEWHKYQHKVQDEIVETLQRHHIETLVLKGTHTAQYYPIAEWREFGDLDLYFYDKHDEADIIVHKALKAEINNDAHHHTKYNYKGVTVESHYDFLNIHYPPSNRRYERLLKELAPSPTFEVLFLLRHMACHFAASRITLRDLVDWMLTCRALADKVDWKQAHETIKTYGMEDFAAAICHICETRLGGRFVLNIQHFNDWKTVEHDTIYGGKNTTDGAADGLSRLGWKLRRWQATGWKRRMVYNDTPAQLLLASITSHSLKPQSILHKM
ncbi:MAG: nucleotidyltransferase family protein [Bacteroidales bacterium]|nr:nucleotidyltransferase family protein [Bacteroidales bacterium]